MRVTGHKIVEHGFEIAYKIVEHSFKAGDKVHCVGTLFLLDFVGL